jgi:putative transposase
MANTYSQVHLHFVIATKYRNALIHENWEDELYKYITGIVQFHKHKIIIINGVADHLHLFVGFRTTQSIADFMQDIKTASSRWINENKLCKGKFEWQSGFGVFSYSKSQLPNVIKYIENQKEHHKKRTFVEEYILLLKKFDVDFDERYIFHAPE